MVSVGNHTALKCIYKQPCYFFFLSFHENNRSDSAEMKNSYVEGQILWRSANLQATVTMNGYKGNQHTSTEK